MEREQKEAGERYVAVQEFRSYLADLLDCLQHKSVIVEELEDRVYELLDDRAAAEREQAQGWACRSPLPPRCPLRRSLRCCDGPCAACGPLARAGVGEP